ncbi:MAG: FAD:protein FMN transferase [Minisyncoccia bacterium]
MTQFNFEGIGTKWQIDIYQKISEIEEKKILLAIQDRIEIFDKTYSRFRSDSLVTKMSQKSGNFLLPPDAGPMLRLYENLYELTNGFFTPLVGDILSDAGYDANYSLRQKKELAAAPKWNEVLEYKNPNLIIKKPAILDFGAAGKGYLIDLVAKVLEENNIFKYCVDAGGDILHKDKTALRVGLENPENIKEVIGVYGLQNGSICGSAGNRRVWGNFTHIINPKTLVSPTEIIAVWVIAEKAMLADALVTCLFFVEAEKLEKYKFEYLIIHKDHSIEKSQNFSGEIFTTS